MCVRNVCPSVVNACVCEMCALTYVNICVCEMCALTYVSTRAHQHVYTYVHFSYVCTCVSKASVVGWMQNVCTYVCEYMCVSTCMYVCNLFTYTLMCIEYESGYVDSKCVLACM